MLFKTKTHLFSEAREAVVEDPVHTRSRGTIKCQGIFYQAELYGAKQPALSAGQRVYMVGIRNNVALVVLQVQQLASYG
ncbi:NfeD family protein [cf. Phormidesmis sp. LEGE 11477]|uniref:NfeD family protein n=1 Tax=cf. Phormidesmis sp. LEGE 11477 TaxID=1828680 RepID=UPI00187EC9B4|nr:NfeD family protein [cf. Phormidesmis sp. LEGE 11477]MBE9062479.1 NfeD family protein [cf. Phormidesmis sp. LEGE 11477]